MTNKENSQNNEFDDNTQRQADNGAAEAEEIMPEESGPLENEAPAENAEGAEGEAENAAEARQADKAQEYFDMLQRLAAEYDNYRKRTIKEKETLYQTAVADTVSAFLPVLDNLERCVLALPEGDGFTQGVEMILRQMKDILKGLGVSEIPALGEKFDPSFHEAISHVEDSAVDEKTIVEEFQKGYMLGDRVLRHSMVKVAN